VLTASFVTTAGTTMRLGRRDLSEPFLAVCQVSVVWTAGAVGAGLGDTLPGQSGGRDVGEIADGLE
jgi:hypothetical protein